MAAGRSMGTAPAAAVSAAATAPALIPGETPMERAKRVRAEYPIPVFASSNIVSWGFPDRMLQLLLVLLPVAQAAVGNLPTPGNDDIAEISVNRLEPECITVWAILLVQASLSINGILVLWQISVVQR